MKEKRETERRKLERSVIVERQDGLKITCSLADVSRSGARLSSEQPELIPDEFILVLREDLRRRCKVVVRSAISIGVVFVGRPEDK
jgi:hypothetical protein